jgi:hypothetical protein
LTLKPFYDEKRTRLIGPKKSHLRKRQGKDKNIPQEKMK